ncbi:MAG: pyridoxamine 5'-phosphate oxidase [Leptolyngbyaceae bacterium]|nr:pyridoxamine 5'-phosphate oxidase [Leptolyngbyaceae bacterium]
MTSRSSQLPSSNQSSSDQSSSDLSFAVNVADLRRDYRVSTLEESDASADPVEQFERWWKDVLDAKVSEPNGMTLATVGADGRPSARIVLLKGFDHKGFKFFTNYTSRKGTELENHPYGAIVFWWEPLERQVRIEGTVERLTPEESDDYFERRPKGSRLGAWASPQSQVIENRQVLEDQQAEFEEKYGETEDIPRPPHWGGFRLVPDRMEFWQGRSSRLHDRLCYTKTENGWSRTRLAP